MVSLPETPVKGMVRGFSYTIMVECMKESGSRIGGMEGAMRSSRTETSITDTTKMAEPMVRESISGRMGKYMTVNGLSA